MKVLMVGPGRGSNIRIWLDYFNTQNEVDLSFLSEGEFQYTPSQYSNIDVLYEIKWKNPIEKVRNLFGLISVLLRSRFDVIHIHGMYSIFLTFFYMLFLRKGKKIINIWGEQFIMRASNPANSFWLKPIYRYVLNQSDLILINWWGVYNLFSRHFPEYIHKVKVCPWGINRNVLAVKTEDHIDKFEQKMNLGKSEIVIGTIRGLVSINHQDLILDALKILKDRLDPELFQRIRCIMINGVNLDPEYVQLLVEKRQKYGLGDQVLIDSQTFLDISDVMTFHQRVDIEPIIASSDQLSNTIIEAIYKGTFVVLSDIEPYRIFNERYNLGLQLIPIDADQLANVIEVEVHSIDRNGRRRGDLFEKIQHDFIFENNVKKIIQIYKTMIGEG